MVEWFSVSNVFFRVLGYDMSYIEFFGTVFNVVSVWLVTRHSIWTWPVGNVAVILIGILFWQIQLYSDFFEQCYFLLAGFYGWWVWARLQAPDQLGGPRPITRSSRRELAIYVVAIIGGTAALSFAMANVHIWWPQAFPQKADYVVPDAFTTILSFAATILMAHKRINCWYLWITVDLIGIWLYWVKGVRFISLEYVLFLGLASWGLWKWLKLMRTQDRVPAPA